MHTYIYSLIRQDLHVHPSHQFLLVKNLKIGNFLLLQYLLQYQVIQNNREIAILLTNTSEKKEKYSEVFHLGIDMLFRLKDNKTLVILLVENEKFMMLYV